MGKFGRFDRHAIARQHVKMRRAREGFDSSFDCQQGGFDEAPFPPPTFGAAFGEGDIGVCRKNRAHFFKISGFGAAIEMNRHKVTHRRQPLRLSDDPFGVFVTKKDVGDSCHIVNIKPLNDLLLT